MIRSNWFAILCVLLFSQLFPSLTYGQAPFLSGQDDHNRARPRPGRHRRPAGAGLGSVPAKIYSRQSDDYYGIHAWRRQPQGGQSCVPLVPSRRPDHRQLKLRHGFPRHTRRVGRAHTISTSSITWARPTAVIIRCLSPAKTPASTPSTNCAPPPASKSAASPSVSPLTMKAVCSATCSASKTRCLSLHSAAPNSIRQ